MSPTVWATFPTASNLQHFQKPFRPSVSSLRRATRCSACTWRGRWWPPGPGLESQMSCSWSLRMGRARFLGFSPAAWTFVFSCSSVAAPSFFQELSVIPAGFVFPLFREPGIPPPGLALVHTDFWKPQPHQWAPRESSTLTFSHRALGHY